MRVLVLSINYAPEPTGFAPHVTSLCEYLMSRGHTVTVITGFPFAPHWVRWPEYRGAFMADEAIRQVQVLRVSHYIPRHPGNLLQRLLMETTFCLTALLAILPRWRKGWDVILYVGAQPSLAMLTRCVASLQKVPYVVNINDLAAQAAADVGIVRSGWLQKTLTDFEYTAYQGARGAIVLCSAFREALIARGYPEGRIRVIPSPTDVELVRPVSGGNGFRIEHRLAERDFVVLYSGSMGLKQGLTNVVEAARLLRAAQPDVKWVLVGDGELRPVVERLLAEYELEETVCLLPLQPEDQMSSMFAAADVLLLNQVSNVKDTVIPSKLLTYMAAGRPVLAAVNPNSEGAALLRAAQGGLTVPPEAPAALVDGVKQLRGDPAMRVEMGRRNRVYAEQHFDRRKIVAAQEAFLLEIVRQAQSQG